MIHRVWLYAASGTNLKTPAELCILLSHLPVCSWLALQNPTTSFVDFAAAFSGRARLDRSRTLECPSRI